jgi:hypothetical protein
VKTAALRAARCLEDSAPRLAGSVGTTLTALAAVLVCAPIALAQGGYRPEDVPDPVAPEEIEHFVNEVFERAPEAEVEVDGLFHLTYRQVQADPMALAISFTRQLPSNKQPRGVTPEVYARQFLPHMSRILQERLAQLGTLTALTALKVGSKRIPAGDHHFGLAYERDRPAAIVIHGVELRRPVTLALRLGAGEEERERLLIEVDLGEGRDEGEARFLLTFSAELKALTRQAIEADPRAR